MIEIDDNDDPDDDEVIVFYLQQKSNRVSRTGPTTEASNKKKTKNEENQQQPKKKSPVFKCNLCDFKTDTQTRLNLHNEALHTGKTCGTCDKCDFRFKTKTQHDKHLQVAHSKIDKLCWFWENDTCLQGNNCRFIHRTNQRNHVGQRKNPPCWYQDNCRKPQCPFGHGEETNPNFLGNRAEWKPQNQRC